MSFLSIKVQLKAGRLPFSQEKSNKLGCAGVKLLVQLEFWVQKTFGSKKLLGPEKLWVGKEGGDPFLGFRVAYIPNLSLLQSLEPFEKKSKI